MTKPKTAQPVVEVEVQPEEVAQITIDRIDSETIIVPLRGLTPLIMHRWSEKAKRQMLAAQQGRKAPKETRDPQAEYEAALYRLGDGYGFPASAFKKATVGAARFYGKDVPMTALKQFLFMRGEQSDTDGQMLVPIEGEPKLREDMVTVGRGTDLRYRPEFTDWSARLTVTYVRSCLSQSSVLSLIDAGGMGVGVGDWRPEKGGEFGCYEIDTSLTIEVV